jgi:hypothetical protein
MFLKNGQTGLEDIPLNFYGIAPPGKLGQNAKWTPPNLAATSSTGIGKHGFTELMFPFLSNVR